MRRCSGDSNDSLRSSENPRSSSSSNAAGLLELWHKHWRYWREYLERMDDILDGGDRMPTCRAGLQSFNIDHLGNAPARRRWSG